MHSLEVEAATSSWGRPSRRHKSRAALDVDGSDRVEKETMLQQVHDLLLETLPEKNRDDLDVLGLAPYIALFNIFLWLSVFLGLLFTGIQTELSRKFLALTAPPASDAKCSTIPIAITGTFLCDTRGNWNTHTDWGNTPVYSLQMTGTTVTRSQYEDMMISFTKDVVSLGARMQSMDLISAQIAWSLFQATDADTQTLFRTCARLDQLFSGLVLVSLPALSSAAGVCQNNYLSKPTLNDATLLITVTFPQDPSAGPPTAKPTPRPPSAKSPSPQPTSTRVVDQFVEFCPDQLNVGNGTFMLYSNPSDYWLELDVASSATAFALNFGLISTDILQPQGSRKIALGPLGVVELTGWTHPAYPNMIPIGCFQANDLQRVCLVRFGDTDLYPVFTTSSYSTSPSEPCRCPQDADSSDCNGQDRQGKFQLSLLFPSSGGPSKEWDVLLAGAKLQQMMAADPVHGPDAVKALVAGLGYTAAYFAEFQGAGNMNYTAWRNGGAAVGKTKATVPPFSDFAADFGSLGEVSLLSFEVTYNGNSAPFNQQGVSLNMLATTKKNVTQSDGSTSLDAMVACRDTVYQANVLNKLAQEPPVATVQPYLSCTPTPWSAAFTAIGVAAANAALVSSIALGALLFCVVQWIGLMHEERRLIPWRKQDRREKDRLWREISELRALVSGQQQPQKKAVDIVPPPSLASAGDNPIHAQSQKRL